MCTPTVKRASLQPRLCHGLENYQRSDYIRFPLDWKVGPLEKDSANETACPLEYDSAIPSEAGGPQEPGRICLVEPYQQHAPAVTRLVTAGKACALECDRMGDIQMQKDSHNLGDQGDHRPIDDGGSRFWHMDAEPVSYCDLGKLPSSPYQPDDEDKHRTPWSGWPLLHLRPPCTEDASTRLPPPP